MHERGIRHKYSSSCSNKPGNDKWFATELSGGNDMMNDKVW